MTKTIAVITPGGDAPGMNACLRAVVRSACAQKYRVFGIRRGYAGLLCEDFIELNSRSVSNIIQRGGTILGSARCKEIREAKGIRRASEILVKHGIDWMIVIGGDGSTRAAWRISKECGVPLTSIPASIDNDVFGTDETIGFDTAIDTAIEAIDKIRDTATSFQRVFVIEVMGREHGFLALNIAIASGADFAILPEIQYSLDEIAGHLLQGKRQGKTSAIIVFAEGAGDPKLFAEELQKRTALEVRLSSLGYIQRGGDPSARSRVHATCFGVHAVNLIKHNKRNRLVVINKGILADIPLSASVGKTKKIDPGLYALLRRLSL